MFSYRFQFLLFTLGTSPFSSLGKDFSPRPNKKFNSFKLKFPLFLTLESRRKIHKDDKINTIGSDSLPLTWKDACNAGFEAKSEKWNRKSNQKGNELFWGVGYVKSLITGVPADESFCSCFFFLGRRVFTKRIDVKTIGYKEPTSACSSSSYEGKLRNITLFFCFYCDNAYVIISSSISLSLFLWPN